MPFPTSTSASDVWSLKSQYIAIAGDNWPVLPLPDPNFNRVSLLLNGDGPDGGQNNTYTDSSSIGHTITPAGTIEQGSVSPFGDNWANYFDGPANNAYLRTSGGATFSGDLTAECWVNCDYIDSTGGVILDFRGGAANSNPAIYAPISGELNMYVNGTSYPSGVFILNDGQWHHVALVRSSGVYTLYVDGVSTTTASVATSFTAARFQIGADDDGSPNAFYGGYISNLRIVNGTALYTSAFTPPTEPLTAISGTELLTCQSNYFVDNSTNGFTLTIAGTPKVTSFSPFANSAPITLADNGGSVHISGAGDYLSIADDPSIEVGANDFTLECWIYNTESSAYSNAGIVGKWNGPAGLRSYAIYFDVSNLLTFAISSTSSYEASNALTSSVTATSLRNQWNHIRACKSGTTSYLFLNGISIGSTTVSSTVNNNANALYVGKINSTSIQGYISNVRLINGTALSTSNFTPPTAPLTAVTNTALLLNFADAAIFDYTALNNLSTVGNADISTSVVKYNTGSLAFDGTGDFLSTPYTSVLDFGTGDFTVECWVYVTGNGTGGTTYQCIFGSNSNSPPSYWNVYRNITNDTLVFFGDDNTIRATSSTIPNNSWAHIAFSRASGTLKGFINGVEGYSATVTTSYTTNASGFRVGYDHGASNAYFQGYIDDLRITNGLARYTANFTPPEAALPTF